MTEISQSCVAYNYQLMSTQGTGKKLQTELINLQAAKLSSQITKKKSWVGQLCYVRINFSAGSNVQMLLLVLEHLDRIGNKVSI